MKIYTKTGDRGETSLFGGTRVSKNNLRLEAYGTVDELNSALGLCICASVAEDVQELLTELQNRLFDAGSDLATPSDYSGSKISVPRISGEHIEKIESAIDRFDSSLPALTGFILPGGSESAARLHLARSICRRAERHVVALQMGEEINPNLVIFLNRISDLLFVLARYENKVSGKGDVNWTK
ncbi:MAG: cob(I)yrinic acid a,c-diamide adenosyltransferase [Ignavibacteriaceae bacterium]|nr:cob(I)yrinic acid a,c-diamide adenosyltransferase [Ignavibacteriaceae bacterium]